MPLSGKVIGFGLSASHCNLEKAMAAVQSVRDAGARVVPVLSYNASTVETRFGKPEDWMTALEQITGERPKSTIPEVEPFGPQKLLDAMVVLPCTGNTLAKLANAITESPVHMAAKSTLRNSRPVILAVTSNDILGLNAKNLGILLAARHFYFVPFGQDNPFAKPTSVEAHFDLVAPTVVAALEGRQLQPLLQPYATAGSNVGSPVASLQSSN